MEESRVNYIEKRMQDEDSHGGSYKDCRNRGEKLAQIKVEFAEDLGDAPSKRLYFLHHHVHEAVGRVEVASVAAMLHEMFDEPSLHHALHVENPALASGVLFQCVPH
jgi:hypothetical protein